MTKLKDNFRLAKAGEGLEKLTQNPGMNMLELGGAKFYLFSHFNLYRYNLTTIKSEHNKILKHKNEILNHKSKHKHFGS